MQLYSMGFKKSFVLPQTDLMLPRAISLPTLDAGKPHTMQAGVKIYTATFFILFRNERQWQLLRVYGITVACGLFWVRVAETPHIQRVGRLLKYVE
jgi:hypothetical protein